MRMTRASRRQRLTMRERERARESQRETERESQTAHRDTCRELGR